MQSSSEVQWSLLRRSQRDGRQGSCRDTVHRLPSTYHPVLYIHPNTTRPPSRHPLLHAIDPSHPHLPPASAMSSAVESLASFDDATKVHIHPSLQGTPVVGKGQRHLQGSAEDSVLTRRRRSLCLSPLLPFQPSSQYSASSRPFSKPSRARPGSRHLSTSSSTGVQIHAKSSSTREP